MTGGSRAFRVLLAARVVSYAGDSLSLVALMLHVAQSTGQALAVAVLLLVGDFAPSLLAPLTGALSDRFDRRALMITCELVQAAALIAIAFLPGMPLLLALVAVRAIAGQTFQPASRSAVPDLVADADLPRANALLGFGTNGAEAVGPLLAAALIPVVGIRGVLLADAASFLLSAAILTLLPRLSPAAADSWSFSTGVGYILRNRTVRVICLGYCAVVACNGVDDVALVLLATETYRAGDWAVGLLLGGVGVGLFAGYLLLSRYGGRVALPVLLIAGFAVSSLGNLLTGLAWAVAAAFALQAVRGIGIAALDVAANTLLPRLVEPGYLGRVFGNLYGAIGVAAALSYVGGGLLLDATSAPVTLIVAGAGGTAVTVVTGVALRRALRHT